MHYINDYVDKRRTNNVAKGVLQKGIISALLIKFCSIVQLVERLTVNQDVTGSSPVRAVSPNTCTFSSVGIRAMVYGTMSRRFESCKVYYMLE